MTDENRVPCPHGGTPPCSAADKTGKARPMESQFFVCFILLFAYSAIMLIVGLFMVFDADATFDAILMLLQENGATFEDFVNSMGMDVTEEEFMSYMNVAGTAAILTAIPTTLSTVLCFMRRKHMLAVLFSAVATLAVFIADLFTHDALGAVLDTLIGAVVTYILYKNCRCYFED